MMAADQDNGLFPPILGFALPGSRFVLGGLACAVRPSLGPGRTAALVLAVLQVAATKHHVKLQREGYRDYTWAWHDSVEIGPVALRRIAKHTGLTPEDL
jgi:hypothetical protein